jgi:hypothetical protein
MRTNLARNDDLQLRDHPTQNAEIQDTQPLPAPSKSSFLLKLWLVFALLLTLAWTAGLGWATARVVFSLF